jgi:membrane protein DedA with SNARE-associated domain
MAAAGALASQGEIHLWSVLLVGTLGAEVGAIAGWWLGTHLARAGDQGTGRVARRASTVLTSGERFAARWGRLMVFMVSSWVCGALGMPLRQFALWNLLAAAGWTVAAGLTAYGVGFAISGGSGVDSAVAIGIGLAVLLAIAVLLVRRSRRRAAPAS